MGAIGKWTPERHARRRTHAADRSSTTAAEVPLRPKLPPAAASSQRGVGAGAFRPDPGGHAATGCLCSAGRCASPRDRPTPTDEAQVGRLALRQLPDRQPLARVIIRLICSNCSILVIPSGLLPSAQQSAERQWSSLVQALRRVGRADGRADAFVADRLCVDSRHGTEACPAQRDQAAPTSIGIGEGRGGSTPSPRPAGTS